MKVLILVSGFFFFLPLLGGAEMAHRYLADFKAAACARFWLVDDPTRVAFRLRCRNARNERELLDANREAWETCLRSFRSEDHEAAKKRRLICDSHQERYLLALHFYRRGLRENCPEKAAQTE